MIKNLEIAKLHPHPDNPRKELGDLTELADSIRARGVLQNLTVVEMENLPGHYRVVIGHRRLAASKVAGLTELPCVIADMDHKTQVETMLLENMQREDLSVYEQAQGFQMLLDFGDSIAEIAEKTGLSQTTVRRRTNLLELDPGKFAESVKRNVTLMDYIRLEEIKDIELRNRVLESAGTANFEYELKKAIDEENKIEWIAETSLRLDAFAVKVEERDSNHRWIKSYYFGHDSEVEVPEDAGTGKYFYELSEYGSFTLYKVVEQNEAEEKEALERERHRARHNALTEISERAYNLRRDFISGLSNSKSDIRIVAEHLTSFMKFSYVSVDPVEVSELLGIALSDDEDEVIANLLESAKKKPERYMLVIVYSAMDSARHNYFTWQGEYKPDDVLDGIYDFLIALGYEMSDEEKELRNGTHDLFVTKGAEE